MRCYLRSENQGLTVGTVQINVLEVRSDSVKLGIHDHNASPKYREEILYLSSGDDDDDEDEANSDFESLQFLDASAFALPVR